MNRLAYKLMKIAEEISGDDKLSSTKISDAVEEMGYDPYEFFEKMEQWLIDGGVYGLFYDSFKPYNYCHVAFEDIGDFFNSIITLEYLSKGLAMEDTEGKKWANKDLNSIIEQMGLSVDGWIHPGDWKEITKDNQITYGTKKGDFLNTIRLRLKITDQNKFKEFVKKVMG